MLRGSSFLPALPSARVSPRASSTLLTPRLSGCTVLQTLTFEEPMFGECVPLLTSMPDLSSLSDLKIEGLPEHLQPWGDGGRKGFSIE